MLHLRRGVFTVEDKDPSVLWQINTDKIFNLWYTLLEKQTNRWMICDYTDEDIVNRHRAILDNILPRNLLRRTHSFAIENVPYAYYTVKYFAR